jgi:hypothetical protein
MGHGRANAIVAHTLAMNGKLQAWFPSATSFDNFRF